MNEQNFHIQSPIQRILTIFDELPTIQSIIVLGSFSGQVETRLIDAQGKTLTIDAEKLFGTQFWRSRRYGATDGLCVRFSRQQIPTQLFEFFGPHEVSRYERSQLDQFSCSTMASHQIKWL